MAKQHISIFDSLQSKANDYIKLNGLDAKNCRVFTESHRFKLLHEDDDKGTGNLKIEGHLSTFDNKDRDGDIVARTAFDKTLKDIRSLGKLPMLKDHRNITDSQVGAFTSFEIDSIGFFVRGFVIRTPKTEHLIKLILEGAIDTLSMGGIFRFSAMDKTLIEDVMLLEGSIVSIPANPKATFTQKALGYDEKEKEVHPPEGDRKCSRLPKMNEVLKELNSRR